jgi:Major tropism determinant N-terminal domain/Pectate lyase superfamily protein
VSIVQISRIQHRRGKATELPQLAAGELGWVIDEQRLYIGNGTVADGAPAVGNTEILTAGSPSFSTALNYVYRGYLGDATPILTGAVSDVIRTLQERLDDYVSVRAFGAVGDGVADDTAALQRALDQIYNNLDQNDARSERILFFPAGVYKTSASLRIPPFANLVGEDIVIYQSGGNGPVAITEDGKGNIYPNIGNASATVPQYINIEGITFKNGEAYPGFSIDCTSHIRFVNCGFAGTYALNGADNSNSRGVTVRSTTALPCSNIIFDRCQFTKFARLVDLSYDLRSTKFINCDFSTAYYGILIANDTNGSTNGLVSGPVDVKISFSQFKDIMRQAFWVVNIGGLSKNIISSNNFYSATVSVNNGGINSTTTFPIIQYDRGACNSSQDFFEITNLRSNALPPVATTLGAVSQGNNRNVFTLSDNQITGQPFYNFPAQAIQSITITYKIIRGTSIRYGTLSINGDTTSVNYSDNYLDASGDVGVTLSAALLNLGGGPGNDTLQVQYTTTNAGVSGTISYTISQLS